jgi:hypothetical protein
MAKRRPPSAAPVHLRVIHRDRGLARERLRCDLGRKTAGYSVTDDRALCTCQECLGIDERVRARDEARRAGPTREQQLEEALRALVDISHVYTCDLCDQPATRYEVTDGEVLCDGCHEEHACENAEYAFTEFGKARRAALALLDGDGEEGKR